MLDTTFNGMPRGKETVRSRLLPHAAPESLSLSGSARSTLIGWAKPLLTLCALLCPHSVILWLGDLNYRIEEPDVEKVKKLVEERAFQTLYAYDQVPAATWALFGQLLFPLPPPQGRAQKAWLPSSSLFFLLLGGFPEELVPSIPSFPPSVFPLLQLSAPGPSLEVCLCWRQELFSFSLSRVCPFIQSFKLGPKGNQASHQADINLGIFKMIY